MILQTRLNQCKVSVLEILPIEKQDSEIEPEKARLTFRNTWKTLWIEIFELEAFIADRNEDRIGII